MRWLRRWRIRRAVLGVAKWRDVVRAVHSDCRYRDSGRQVELSLCQRTPCAHARSALEAQEAALEVLSVGGSC